MVGVIAEEEIVGVNVKLGCAVVAPLRCVGEKSPWKNFSGADLL